MGWSPRLLSIYRSSWPVGRRLRWTKKLREPRIVTSESACPMVSIRASQFRLRDSAVRGAEAFVRVSEFSEASA